MIWHVWQGWKELITTMCFHSADNIIHRASVAGLRMWLPSPDRPDGPETTGSGFTAQ